MEPLQMAVVKSLPGQANMTITLTLGGKPRNLDRPKHEALEKPLSRIQKSAAPQPDKRHKRQMSSGAAAPAAAADLFVGLHEGPSPSDPLLDAATTTNEAAWRQGRLLRVGDAAYSVFLNPPMVGRLEVPGTAFVGIPLMPAVQMHFAEDAACRWQWLRRGGGALPGGAWEPVEGGTGRRFTPTAADAGCALRVECRPGRATEAGGGPLLGEAAGAECGPVAVLPQPLGAAPRHALTGERAAAPSFRVVTYNILADQYAATETAKTVLFAHCPPECLAPDYRRPLVVAELLGFRGDLVCLQEVDDKMFTLHLQPQLGAEGYEGVYTNKAGKVREGSATFWRQDRWRQGAAHSLTLRDFFPKAAGEPSKYGHVFEAMLASSPALQYALQRIATVAQLTLLTPVDMASGDRPLCVANTHLFYHFMAPHIRTMHVWIMMQEAQAFINRSLADPAVASACGGHRPALVFCGDLNSDLNDGIPGAVELLSKGSLPSDFWDWRFGVGFKWGKGEDGEGDGEAADAAQPAATAGQGDDVNGNGAGDFGEVSKMVHCSVEHAHPTPAPVPGVALEIPFRLAPADGLATPFTNHVKGYQGLLDYIWFEPECVAVEREVPVPGLAELCGYLPSQRFPSDHLPVVFDMRFRSSKDGSGSGQGEGEASGSSEAAGSGSGGGGGRDASAGGSGGGGNVLPAAFHNVGRAVKAVQRGQVIAVPTDTLYGLATCAASEGGVAAIFASKQRAGQKPLAICVADPADVDRYGEAGHLPPGLVAELLPGPLTLLLPRRSDAPLALAAHAGSHLIGIRIPDSPFIRAICRQHCGALALTSANLSGSGSSVAVQEFEDLWPYCAAVFDAGPLAAGRAGSTIVDLSVSGRFSVVRRGAGFADLVQLLQGKHGLVHDI